MKERLLGDSKTLLISAIHGLGSVGKSTLAAALAHDPEIQNHFCDGILWATLGQEPNILQHLSNWVKGLGDYNYNATDITSTSLHLSTLLLDKSVLLIVDDAWADKNHGYKHLEAFNVGGSRCQILITSRDATITVDQKVEPEIYYLDEMTEAQTLELVTKKLSLENQSLPESEKEQVKALAKAVGYLPLALDLAVAQKLNGVSWQTLTEEIQEEIGRLDSLKKPGTRYINDDEEFKYRSIKASFNLSFKRLHKQDQEYFAWLGVLPEDARITQKMAATLWGVDERDARDILQYFKSQALLLFDVPLSDGTRAYRLHDLFHDFARNVLTAPQNPQHPGDLIGLGLELKNAHSQLLNKYQQKLKNNLWHTVPNDGYIHQYLVWHFKKAGKIAEIHQLLREESANGNNGWYEVREKLGQTAGFLQDVADASELIKPDFDSENISQIISLQCRYGLILTSLNSLSTNIPKELLVVFVKNKFWQPEQGLAYALQKQDLKDKANSLIALVDYLPETLKQQAIQTVLEIAREIKNDEYHARFISDLAAKLQSGDLYQEALETARKIKDESTRARVITSLAEKLQSEDLYQEALEISCQIQHEFTRTQVITFLAKKLPATLYNKALDIALQIKDKSNQAIIFSSFAISSLTDESSPDLYDKALKSIREIENKYSRASVFSYLAEKSPASLYDKLLETVREVEDESARAIIFSSLVEKLPANLYDKALEIVHEIENESSHAIALSFLAGKFQSKDLYNKVLEITRQIEDKPVRVRITLHLAKKFQSEDLYNEALEVTRQIQNEYYRADVLSYLAEELPANLYNEALEIAREIEDQSSRAIVLVSLAEELKFECFYNEALEIAHEIEDKYSRAIVLLFLAEELKLKYLFKEALEIAHEIENEFSRADFLSSLAENLPTNLYDQALEIAREIKNESARTIVLSSLTEKLPEDLYSKVLDIAHEIENKYSCAIVLLHLAAKFSSESLYNEVLKINLQIEDEYSRASVFSYLAEKKQSKDLYNEALETTRQIEDESARVSVLSSLIEKLPEDFYNKVLEIARQIKNEDSRTIVISLLAEKKQSKDLYDEALEVARQIKSEYSRASVFSYLAAKFSCEYSYNQALEITRQINDEYCRVDVLSSLAAKLPANLYEQALEIVNQIKNEDCRADILSSLAAKLPANLYEQALEIVNQIKDTHSRSKCLSLFFIKMFSDKPKNQIYARWLEILPTLYRLKRREFNESIIILIPLIFQLGGKEALMEIAAAVQDVGRWWR
ncbi:MAG TPA: NB-ARC domain-containing protein [Nostocaceae cyanobacterium]|nr:NB-ARC domain-containing protein [Nostocaceae cyanobacterium]